MQPKSHFYYVFAGRRDLVNYIPRDCEGCEIGVQKAALSKLILERAAPRKLHLIDPWAHSESEAYKKDGANVKQTEQDKIFASVLHDLRHSIASGQVEIHRARSEDAVSDFADKSLDFVYIDGMHNYEAVLSDLSSYAPKLRAGGLLLGHDYSENIYSFGMGFGVVGAVNTFINRSDFRLVALTNDTWATFVLASSTVEGVAKQFLDGLLESELGLVGLPSGLAPSLTHVSHKRENGSLRWLPSF